MPTPGIVRRAVGNTKMGKPKPIWLDTISRLYPPIAFSMPEYIRKSRVGKIPKPPKIVFPEDQYRRRFFAQHKTELWRPITMDERIPSTTGTTGYPDAVFEEQVRLMEKGNSPERAYRMAVLNYQAARKKEELKQRVAQEQFLENATVPSSHIIEKSLWEEKKHLSGENSGGSSNE